MHLVEQIRANVFIRRLYALFYFCLVFTFFNFSIFFQNIFYVFAAVQCKPSALNYGLACFPHHMIRAYYVG